MDSDKLPRVDSVIGFCLELLTFVVFTGAVSSLYLYNSYLSGLTRDKRDRLHNKDGPHFVSMEPCKYQMCDYMLKEKKIS